MSKNIFKACHHIELNPSSKEFVSSYILNLHIPSAAAARRSFANHACSLVVVEAASSLHVHEF
jgi:hypothetical protein